MCGEYFIKRWCVEFYWPCSIPTSTSTLPTHHSKREKKQNKQRNINKSFGVICFGLESIWQNKCLLVNGLCCCSCCRSCSCCFSFFFCGCWLCGFNSRFILMIHNINITALWPWMGEILLLHDFQIIN